jgi:hypothetical protein
VVSSRLPTAATRGRVDMWWTKWYWGRFSPSTLISPANSYSNYCSVITYHPRVITMDPLVTDVPSGLSLTHRPSHPPHTTPGSFLMFSFLKWSVLVQPFSFLGYLLHTYVLTHGAEPFFKSRQLCSHSRTSQPFMEPEGSTPRSHEPSTGPYPEPYQSNPHHLSNVHFNIVHPPTIWSS